MLEEDSHSYRVMEFSLPHVPFFSLVHGDLFTSFFLFFRLFFVLNATKISLEVSCPLTNALFPFNMVKNQPRPFCGRAGRKGFPNHENAH